MSSAEERALGALYGLAIGDALGMPTQLLSRDQVATHFGTIDGFREAPPDHRIAAGLQQGRSPTTLSRRCCWPMPCWRKTAMSTVKTSPAGCWPGPSGRGNEDRWIC